MWELPNPFYMPYRTNNCKILIMAPYRSPCPHTPAILYTTQGSLFNHKSGCVTCLVKSLQGLLMSLHGPKPWMISHFTFPTMLPSLLLQSHAAFSRKHYPQPACSRAFTPNRLPLLLLGSCRYLCGLDHTSLGVLLQNHLHGRPSWATLSRTIASLLSARSHPP